ncbi:hypothetical protein CA85_26410 [Allorhodopirellula solitaria]|uniref:Uncharacterized protein n=1 Tax=Allorhodopirellula solitaria TaxID=2527987 RepID=A0A5C5XUI1_9BACT|nr:hypothetical protein CA85_26410 [Allorhodopirellula solitaria]
MIDMWRILRTLLCGRQADEMLILRKFCYAEGV